MCVCVCVCLETGQTLYELCLGGKIILQQILSEYLSLWGGVIWIRTGSIGGRGPGSVVGIATAYGLDGPGIESRWGEIFRTSPDPP